MNRKTYIKKCMNIGMSKRAAELRAQNMAQYGSYEKLWLFGTMLVGSTMDKINLCADVAKAVKMGRVNAEEADQKMAKFFYVPIPRYEIQSPRRLVPERLWAQRRMSWQAAHFADSDFMERCCKHELMNEIGHGVGKYVTFESADLKDGGKMIMASLVICRDLDAERKDQEEDATNNTFDGIRSRPEFLR